MRKPAIYSVSGAVEVVAALIRWRGLLLVQQRRELGSLPSLWEFPGGKLLPGEAAAAGLARECREELGIEVAVGGWVWTALDVGARPAVRIRFFAAYARAPQRARPLCARQLAWVDIDELPRRVFCPLDVTLVRALVEAGAFSAL